MPNSTKDIALDDLAHIRVHVAPIGSDLPASVYDRVCEVLSREFSRITTAQVYDRISQDDTARFSSLRDPGARLRFWYDSTSSLIAPIWQRPPVLAATLDSLQTHRQVLSVLTISNTLNDEEHLAVCASFPTSVASLQIVINDSHNHSDMEPYDSTGNAIKVGKLSDSVSLESVIKPGILDLAARIVTALAATADALEGREVHSGFSSVRTSNTEAKITAPLSVAGSSHSVAHRSSPRVLRAWSTELRDSANEFAEKLMSTGLSRLGGDLDRAPSIGSSSTSGNSSSLLRRRATLTSSANQSTDNVVMNQRQSHAFRLKKLVADLNLLCGRIPEAVNAYTHAVEMAREAVLAVQQSPSSISSGNAGESTSTGGQGSRRGTISAGSPYQLSDPLWLALALEGFYAALVVQYERETDRDLMIAMLSTLAAAAAAEAGVDSGDLSAFDSNPVSMNTSSLAPASRYTGISYGTLMKRVKGRKYRTAGGIVQTLLVELMERFRDVANGYERSACFLSSIAGTPEMAAAVHILRAETCLRNALVLAAVRRHGLIDVAMKELYRGGLDSQSTATAAGLTSLVPSADVVEWALRAWSLSTPILPISSNTVSTSDTNTLPTSSTLTPHPVSSSIHIARTITPSAPMVPLLDQIPSAAMAIKILGSISSRRKQAAFARQFAQLGLSTMVQIDAITSGQQQQQQSHRQQSSFIVQNVRSFINDLFEMFGCGNELSTVGWPAIQSEILSECVALFTSIGDYDAAMAHLFTQLQLLSNHCPPEEQFAIAAAMRSIALRQLPQTATSSTLAGSSASKVFSCLLKSINFDRSEASSIVKRIRLPNHPRSTSEQESEEQRIRAQIFIYDPLAKQSNEEDSDTVYVVAGEPCAFELSLSNPFVFDIRLDSCKLWSSEGIVFEADQTRSIDNILIPAKSAITVVLPVIPQINQQSADVVECRIDGCTSVIFGVGANIPISTPLSVVAVRDVPLAECTPPAGHLIQDSTVMVYEDAVIDLPFSLTPSTSSTSSTGVLVDYLVCTIDTSSRHKTDSFEILNADALASSLPLASTDSVSVIVRARSVPDAHSIINKNSSNRSNSLVIRYGHVLDGFAYTRTISIPLRSMIVPVLQVTSAELHPLAYGLSTNLLSAASSSPSVVSSHLSKLARFIGDSVNLEDVACFGVFDVANVTNFDVHGKLSATFLSPAADDNASASLTLDNQLMISSGTSVRFVSLVPRVAITQTKAESPVDRTAPILTPADILRRTLASQLTLAWRSAATQSGSKEFVAARSALILEPLSDDILLQTATLSPVQVSASIRSIAEQIPELLYLADNSPFCLSTLTVTVTNTAASLTSVMLSVAIERPTAAIAAASITSENEYGPSDADLTIVDTVVFPRITPGSSESFSTPVTVSSDSTRSRHRYWITCTDAASGRLYSRQLVQC